HAHHAAGSDSAAGSVLTVRMASGLSGDMLLAGLIRMLDLDGAALEAAVAEIGVPQLAGCLSLEPRSVHSIAGWGCRVALPHAHEHRTLADILHIIESGSMAPAAAALAQKTFALLAAAEGRVHGLAPEDVRFHEVGALDSILDICLSCILFERLSPSLFVCSPLPLADGGVFCAHGWLPVPAPAVFELLEGMPVCGFPGRGETVTPTAIALLRALGASFGPWPSMLVERRALVYGSRVFENAPNGTLFAYGKAVES
ncbi:MAG: LarC family nickel insertion protein, partial [Desulfovibrionaceae bacterium]|nr:LarC family nickel insertion protein [Desulfovibrionaceae bacterium]